MADKEEIRTRSDILEVVGSYVTLKRRGRNWVGLCPFHQEKTPSFNVDPVTQSFKCFGCGQSGDVFSFIERYESMSFVEAAELLARRAGLTFDRKGGDGGARLGERERIYEVNALALEWFRRMLDRAQVARDYVYGRGLAHETIQRFQLGYAPGGWDGLTGYLQSRRQDMQVAETAGLLRTGQQGGYYDAFRDRVIFPIHDEQDRVVGFGGRAFGDEQPKYLNTGETPVFAKGRILYGLPFARRKIAAEGRTLLMEGYMDVIAAHQAGFSHAVATLGTSLTDEHARKLARIAPIAVLVYDADSAGIKATLRASETLEKEGIHVLVARLPAGDDPDSLLRRGDPAPFQKAIDSAVGRVEYQLERVVAGADQTSDTGRARMLRQLVAVLASVQTRAERDVYIKGLWQYHPSARSEDGEFTPGTATEQLHRDAEAYAARSHGGAPGPGRRAQATDTLRPPSGAGYGRGGRFARSAPEPPAAPGGSLRADERAELELIRALANPEFRQAVLDRVEPDDFVTAPGRSFYEFVRDNPAVRYASEAELVQTLGASPDEALSAAVRGQLQELHALMANAPMTYAVIDECVSRLRQHRIKRITDEMGQLLQSKAVLTAEDQERVREHRRLLQELKGSSGAA